MYAKGLAMVVDSKKVRTTNIKEIRTTDTKEVRSPYIKEVRTTRCGLTYAYRG